MDVYELLREAAQGNSSAFFTLAGKYSRATVSSVHFLTLCPQDKAEELACDIFAFAFKHLHTLPAPDRFHPWLYGFLRKRCLRHLAGADERQEDDDNFVREFDLPPDPGPDAPLADHLKCLPYTQRELISMRFIHQFSYRDIAWVLQCKPVAVRAHCRKLYEQMGGIVRSR